LGYLIPPASWTKLPNESETYVTMGRRDYEFRLHRRKTDGQTDRQAGRQADRTDYRNTGVTEGVGDGARRFRLPKISTFNFPKWKA
jgi:hypothetical protein